MRRMGLSGLARRYVAAWGVELVMTLVLVLVGAAVFVGSFSAAGIVADVFTVACLVLLLARPVPGTVAMVVAVAVLAGVPVEDQGVGTLVPLVAAAHLVALRRRRLAVVVSVAGWLCGLWASRRAAGAAAWAGALGLWTGLFLAAWFAGWVGVSRRREVADRLVRALEQQRLQVAGELHDNVAHELSLIVMRANQGSLQPQDAAKELAFIAETGARANGYLRNLMVLLRPGEPVRPVDLGAALRRAEHDLTAAGLKVSVEMDGEPGSVPQPVSDAVARVVKEAVNNMVRHAARDRPAAVMVAVMPGRVMLGFTNGCVPHQGRGHGLGLMGMRERVEAVGGSFQAGSSDGVWRVLVSASW